MKTHPIVESVTNNIIRRSAKPRRDYLERVDLAHRQGPTRHDLSCGNLAHGFAACPTETRQVLNSEDRCNIGVVSAYNDLLSAHQPFHRYPQLIKEAAWKLGASAQMAGGVPAMCDGVTQGQDGMELSLFSRDVIAMATVVALSHNLFDAAVGLGVCDKIVPGLLIGALSCGHLPFMLIPAGPMPSGIPNAKKASVRKAYAEGKASRAQLMEAESASYHSAGTCTFYGTANSNQLLMEFMGLQLPGTSFFGPTSALRDPLTRYSVKQSIENSRLGTQRCVGYLVNERSIVNALVGLLASGGSTNHTIHMVAIARAAGILLNWDDIDALSAAVPLLARVYPNGQADVNQFHAAGGIGLLMRQLLDAGLLHGDVETVVGAGLNRYTEEPYLNDGALDWRTGPKSSLDLSVLAATDKPFASSGGLRLMKGNLGRAIAKVSAVAPHHQTVSAPARVFESQQQVVEAFETDQLQGDLVIVVRGQGPKACGMPELHKLTPPLSVLLDRGQAIALVTDGRMSGASGKVLAAIQLVPEAADNAILARVQDGDRITVDAVDGSLKLHVDESELQARPATVRANNGWPLFQTLRQHVGTAEDGASPLL
ncbi:MAG: phosphogluconate dehydratase [Lysobacteraceae bacterium]|nr:MAG: phosphogluconate dehydratase [Xanthomonadaceae bacterium]